MDAGHFVGNQGRKSVSVSEPVVPEQGVSAPASAAEGGGRETPAPSSAILNQQFTTLNSLRRARTWVDVYLVTGTCLHGQIRSFDSNMLLLQTTLFRSKNQIGSNKRHLLYDKPKTE